MRHLMQNCITLKKISEEDNSKSRARILKRRTTLTLPADCLDQAARIASERQVNLSVVMSEALTEGLRSQMETRRSDEILEAYKKAFAGFSDDDLMVLDGINVEPARSKDL